MVLLVEAVRMKMVSSVLRRTSGLVDDDLVVVVADGDADIVAVGGETIDGAANGAVGDVDAVSAAAGGAPSARRSAAAARRRYSRESRGGGCRRSGASDGNARDGSCRGCGCREKTVMTLRARRTWLAQAPIESELQIVPRTTGRHRGRLAADQGRHCTRRQHCCWSAAAAADAVAVAVGSGTRDDAVAATGRADDRRAAEDDVSPGYIETRRRHCPRRLRNSWWR